MPAKPTNWILLALVNVLALISFVLAATFMTQITAAKDVQSESFVQGHILLPAALIGVSCGLAQLTAAML